MSKRPRLMDEEWGLDDSTTDTDSSEEERDETPPKPSGLLFLPFELLSTIFILSENPALPITSQALYRQLYHSPDSLKIRFLLRRNQNDIPKAFEEAIRFPFFNMTLASRLDQLFGQTIPLPDKKIPARLFLAEPASSLAERDQIILGLLERGASANRPKGYPLIKSAQLGRLDQVKLLIRYGADPTVRNNMALRVCAARNNREMVDYFLDELSIKPDSETLKACVQKNLWDMIQVLVDHGAVPDMSTIDFT